MGKDMTSNKDQGRFKRKYSLCPKLLVTFEWNEVKPEIRSHFDRKSKQG